MPIQRNLRILAGTAGILVLAAAPAKVLAASSYDQINLVSDIPGKAALTDPNLLDPWGVAFSATSPFWISNNQSNTASVITGAPTINALNPSVLGNPTGQVNNPNTGAFAGAFQLANGNAASFIFDTQAGTILGWNGGTAASIEATSPGASYTGLAIATSAGSPYLYAANGNGNGSIDVFNSTFAPTTLTGNFADPNLPAGYVPYNIQLIGSQLYVTYVVYTNGSETPGTGIVDIFNTNGTLVQRFSTGGPLDAPWGVTLAPAGFGLFGGDILIGNFLNGEINAFDPSTGAFLGTLDGMNGLPIADPGLWALEFRTGGASNTDPNALYFTAGINDEADGLFAEIVSTPEPSPLLLTGLGVAMLALGRLARRRFQAPQNG